ncbi:MAG: DEAD/DEAH box helicase [Gammaproteobacteria bacterium]|nr:DEAD/DEAH box helicase [Gammaproteobacteria bacterium]
MSQQYVPGMRVEIRDAEWRLQRVDRSSDGGYLLSSVGLSELVRGRSAKFLSKIDTNIRILDPAKTELVDDLSSGYMASQLYIENALRQTPPVDERVHIGHQAAMDTLPFQLDAALQALQQPRQRILISDSVGLGKTLEAGILVSELIRRGRGKRILVLAVKSMLGQFQQEFWQRFTIPLVRLDSIGLQRVRNRIPTNHNPFHYFDRAIISIDTLKQTLEYRHYLEQSYWDIIVIDEAHNVARRSTNSQRHQLAELLSTRSDSLIMLSATPHDGKAESFASLMNMLDPTAIANPKSYAHEDFRDKGLVIRRFKKDIANQLTAHFPEREIKTEVVQASLEEENVFTELSETKFHTLDGKNKGAGQLFRTTLEKAYLSSPAACISTTENRLKRLKAREVTPEIAADISVLEGLLLALNAISDKSFSKYQLLLQLLDQQSNNGLGWKPSDTNDRLVIFTESLETLKFLEERLPKDLKLKKKQVGVMRGTMRDRDLMKVVDDFGDASKDIRLLLCSDVASEGINLHHLSHRMIHFDIPWSLMVFQQRNGRIDRYGQKHAPQIRYLMTLSEHPKVRADQRILEVLIQKDEQAGINIGDPSEFMGVFSAEEEEERVAEAIEKEKDPNDLTDIFANLFGETAEHAESGLESFIPQVPATNATDLDRVTVKSRHLFSDDLAYAKAALGWLKEKGVSVNYTVDESSRLLDMESTRDLQLRLKYLPIEARPKDDRFLLTDDKDLIQEAIRNARDGDESIQHPMQYLWQLHPVMEWLHDRVQDGFGRHTAPVVRMPDKLAEDECWFIVQGGFPNKRGQALIQSSIALQLTGNTITAERSLEELLEHLNLNGSSIANPSIEGDTRKFQDLLPTVIERVRHSLKTYRDRLEVDRSHALNQHLDELEQLRNKHIKQMELDFGESDQPNHIKEHRKQERAHQIERNFNEYRHWLEETQQTEQDPYMQVVAVFTGQVA